MRNPRSPRRRLARWLAAMVALGTGCAAPRPAPHPAIRPQPPDSWESASAPPLEPTTADSESSWWSRFRDPRLEALIADALAGNQDLASAAARLDAAVAQARIAGADLAPRVAASGDPTRRRQNFIGFPIPGREGSVLSSTATTLGVSLNVSWEVDLWGRLRAAETAAAARALASGADLESARLSLAGQTAKAWFAILEAEQQVALAEETVANRSRAARQIRQRFERGLRGALDLRLALSSEATAAASLARRQRQADGARRQLKLLLGRYPARELEFEELPPLPEPPLPPAAGLPAELVRRRPDLAAAEQRLAATGLDVAAARAALYPRLTLTGAAGRLSSEVEDLLQSDFSVWSLASSLLQPVFQGGRLRAGVEASQARQREAAHAYAQRLLQAFAEVELALAGAGHLDAVFDSLSKAATQATAAEALAEERYLSGLGDYLSVLEAQRQAFLARSQLLEVERQRLDNRIDLYLALGGSAESGGEPPTEAAASSSAATPTRR